MPQEYFHYSSFKNLNPPPLHLDCHHCDQSSLQTRCWAVSVLLWSSQQAEFMSSNILKGRFGAAAKILPNDSAPLPLWWRPLFRLWLQGPWCWISCWKLSMLTILTTEPGFVEQLPHLNFFIDAVHLLGEDTLDLSWKSFLLLTFDNTGYRLPEPPGQRLYHSELHQPDQV